MSYLFSHPVKVNASFGEGEGHDVALLMRLYFFVALTSTSAIPTTTASDVRRVICVESIRLIHLILSPASDCVTFLVSSFVAFTMPTAHS